MCLARADQSGDNDADAIELLAERRRTALQIEMHLTLAFEHTFRLGEKPVSVEVVEQVLSRAIDEIEPTLIEAIASVVI